MCSRLQSAGSGFDEIRSLVGRQKVRVLLLLAGSAWALCGCDSTPRGEQGLGGSFFGGLPAAAPAPQAEAAGSQALVRDIEEADIVKIAGDRLYALNRFKGLLIIDVSNPDAPALLGELDLRGRGVEMYVAANRVYAVLSADFFHAMAGGAPGMGMMPGVAVAPGPAPPRPDFEGSQLAIVDVSNAAVPGLMGKINLVGFASDSRRVGDIIYVVGGNFVPFHSRQTDRADAPVQDGFVASINVADPSHIVPVERETFSGRGLEIHVSQDAIYAAGQEYDSNTGGSITRVQVIDISDPAGTITLRDTFDVPGFIRNRFYMDDYQGVFRIATESDGFGFREVRLFTYSLANLDDVTPLGQVSIIQGESLEAVRFDGPRGYAVTFLRVDPLFVLDLSNPAAPVVAGELKVPGFSTHIEPRGSRLIAVGVDDTDGRRPAVAYYNVEDPANPTQLGRVVLGPPGSFTESEAIWDEKAFKVIDALGLIVIPFKHVDFPDRPPGPIPVPFGGGGVAFSSSEAARPRCTNGVQLVDFSDTALTQRGAFEHEGRVERVGVVGERIFALSQVGLQTVDISDRSNPVQRGKLEFFSADVMPMYADDCFGYFSPDVIGPPWFEFGPMAAFLQMLRDSGMCGAVGILPMALMPAGLWLMRGRARRR